MTPGQRARRRAAEVESRARLRALTQDLRPISGKVVVDRRGRAYQVQPDGSIRRVEVAPAHPAQEA